MAFVKTVNTKQQILRFDKKNNQQNWEPFRRDDYLEIREFTNPFKYSCKAGIPIFELDKNNDGFSLIYTISKSYIASKCGLSLDENDFDVLYRKNSLIQASVLDRSLATYKNRVMCSIGDGSDNLTVTGLCDIGAEGVFTVALFPIQNSDGNIQNKIQQSMKRGKYLLNSIQLHLDIYINALVCHFNELLNHDYYLQQIASDAISSTVSYTKTGESVYAKVIKLLTNPFKNQPTVFGTEPYHFPKNDGFLLYIRGSQLDKPIQYDGNTFTTYTQFNDYVWKTVPKMLNYISLVGTWGIGIKRYTKIKDAPTKRIVVSGRTEYNSDYGKVYFPDDMVLTRYIKIINCNVTFFRAEKTPMDFDLVIQAKGQTSIRITDQTQGEKSFTINQTIETYITPYNYTDAVLRLYIANNHARNIGLTVNMTVEI